jgi:large subunit ribosomal protein L9
MKVILLQELDNLGDEGDIVTVKDGYGRNFLIPRGLAKVATTGAVKAWQEERRQASRKLAQRREDAERLAAELSRIELVVTAKVGAENRIFGSITSQQIVDALAHEGVSVDRRKVEMTEDVRHIGVYTAEVKLHPEVVAQVKVRVEPEGGAAAAPEVPAPETPASETPVEEPAPADDAGPDFDLFEDDEE